jgi:hypothetical protein
VEFEPITHILLFGLIGCNDEEIHQMKGQAKNNLKNLLL